MIKLDLAQEIIPKKTLGNINIGTKICKLTDIMNIYNIGIHEDFCAFIDKTHVRYWVSTIPIEFAINICTGRAYQVTAMEGYKGKFMNKIKLGDTFQDLFDMELGFYYNDTEQAVVSDNIDGIAFVSFEDDPFEYEIPDLKIDAISIEDKEEFFRKI